MAFTGIYNQIVHTYFALPNLNQYLLILGYVFKDKDHIKPYLEDSETGTSVQWAKDQG